MAIGISKGKHDEGCHICGGFPGSLQKPVNVLYQCSNCGFFTCNKHTAIELMQKVCPNCKSPKLRSAMTQSSAKKTKKGGLPGSSNKGLATEKNKAGAGGKSKGFTPIAGAGAGSAGGGSGLFGGGGIFGGGKSSDGEGSGKDGNGSGRTGSGKGDKGTKLDKSAKNGKDVSIDSDAKDSVEVSTGKDGSFKVKVNNDDADDENITLNIKINKKDAKSGINISFEKDDSSKNKVMGFSAGEIDAPFSRNTHSPIPAGLGEELESKLAEAESKNNNSSDDGDTENGITIVLDRPGDEGSGGGYKGGNDANFESTDEATKSLKVADIKGDINISDADISNIIDAAMEDEDLAKQLLDQIEDDELKKLAEEYLFDDEEDDGEGSDNEDKKEKRNRKKSKLLREYAKSLKPKTAKSYTTEQVFKELEKSVNIYEEYPDEETKPSFLHPALADAFFKPSDGGLSTMKNRAGEFYSSKSTGKQKTIAIVQFDLAESTENYYQDLLSETSLILGATAFAGRYVNKFDEEKLRIAIEDTPGIIAVGVAGLDMHYSPHTIEKQKDMLIKHIQIAMEYQLPLFITSEKADDILIKLFTELDFKIDIPIIYTAPINSIEILDLCKKYDMYILLRSEITLDSYKETYLKFIKEIPEERWLLASGSEFIIPVKDNDEYSPPTNNPLIPEVAPETNKEGKTLVTGDSIFINTASSSGSNQQHDNWNKPELIRDTLHYIVKTFNKNTHPFYKQLTENFIYLFNGDASRDLRNTIKNEIEESKKVEKKEDKVVVKKVLVIKPE